LTRSSKVIAAAPLRDADPVTGRLLRCAPNLRRSK
jgi:hypothetical protein